MILIACTSPAGEPSNTGSPAQPVDASGASPPASTPTVEPTDAVVAAPDTPQALEALLPSRLETGVVPGEVLAEGDQRFATLLEALGAGAGDLVMAHGSGSTAQVTAIQVRGSDAGGWLEDYMSVHHPTPLAPAEFDGKQVLTGPEPDPGYSDWQIYAYAWEDVLFIVQAQDEAAAQQLLSDLP